MEKIGLIPNRSYDIFVFGDEIANYLHLPHFVDEHDDDNKYFYDSYFFVDYKFVVWVENGKIDTIKCEEECFWQGKNLIGMLYDDFLPLVNNCQPDSEDNIYLPVDRDRGRNHKVYDFDDLGISVWVWRKKIKNVLLCTYEGLEEDETEI